MDSSTLLPSLSLMTLIGILLILIIAFGFFLRSRRNRAAATRALGINDPESADSTVHRARHPEG